MEIRTDRRSIQVAPADEGMDLVARGAAALREAEVLVARGLLAMHRSKSYVRHGHASAVDCAVHRFGLDLGRARELLRVGRLFELVPGTEQQVADARLTAQVAGEIGKLPEFARRRPEALDREEAERLSREALERARGRRRGAARDFVRARIEEAAQSKSLVRIVLDVSEKTRDEFHRCRVLGERAARGHRTAGETFAQITRFFLAHKDPLRRGKGRRRVPDTADLPGRRYVPAEAERAVLERSGDRCEYGSCSNETYLHNAHHEAHARGGSRERDNLERLCSGHHVLKDAGLIERIAMGPEGPTYRVRSTGETVPPRGAEERLEGARGPSHGAEGSRGPPGWGTGPEDDPPSPVPSVREAGVGYGTAARSGRAKGFSCRGSRSGAPGRRRPSPVRD